MLYLKLLYAVAFPSLLGFCIINLFLYKKEDATFLERVALGFCIGLVLITAEMFFVLSRLNINFSVLSISIPIIPLILAGLYITYKNKLIYLKMPKLSGLTILEILLLIIILLEIFFVFSSQMIKPVTGWDAWAGYSFRAKAYFVEGTANVPSLPPTIRGQHNALAQTWIFLCINEWDEIVGKIIFPFYYFCLLIIFYCSVRRFRTRLVSLLSTAVLSSLPFLVYHATLEYCDLLIGIYLFAGIVFMHLWLNRPQLRYLLLSLLFLLSTITIKKESYFHLTIVFLVFLAALFSIKHENVKEIKYFRAATAVFLFVGGLYILLQMVLRPYEGHTFSASFELFNRVQPLLLVFADYIFVRNNWSIAWPMLILILIFNFNDIKKNHIVFILSITMLEFFGFMAYYFFVNREAYEWLFYVTPAVRNMLQFIPVVIFLFANLLNLECPRYSIPDTSIKRARKT